MRYEEQEALKESRFWKTYFITAAAVLAIGLLPSIVIISKQGMRVLLPEHLQEESVSDILAQDWIIYPKSTTGMTGTERGETLIELNCFDPEDVTIPYYKEQFEKRGYTQKVETSSLGTTITAKKDKVLCQVKISGRTVQIIVSKVKG